MIKHLEENNLNELIASGEYLLDFYAPWCGPCKMLASVLEEVDFIEVIKINTDSFPEIAREYSVMSIPTLVLIKDGNIVDQTIGFKSLEELKEFTKKQI